VYANTRDELLATTVADLARPAERIMVGELLAESKPAERLGPFHLVGKHEAEIEVRITSYAVTFRDRPARFMLLEDVGERERFERRLRQSQRLESLGHLAGGVAHDFNNVLAVIGGFAQEVTRRVAPPDESDADRWRDVQENVEQIEHATQRGTRLTRQLLAFARQEDVRPTVLDVNEVTSQLTPMLRHAVGAGVHLDVALGDDLWPVEIDQGQFEQVLLNLAVNARDAMPRGGQLSIQTANINLDEEYVSHHGELAVGPHVMLAVSDTGVGIEPDVAEHIFEPFFTTKPVGTGTGLGLATVYGIVRQSGGSIWVYSEPGEGTTFKIYLPVVHAPIEEERAPEARPDVGGSETVLLAEDNDALRELIAHMLVSHGYEVIVAETPTDAVRLAREESDRIALLISDLVMPEMSGTALAERVADLVPGVRVLLMSGYTDEAVARSGSLAPGAEYLEKPFGADELAAKVRETLDGDSPS
jgi:two-component system, cell cycle sensor histidine kinase and response regulator CckA